jgi:hypothetical protein
MLSAIPTWSLPLTHRYACGYLPPERDVELARLAQELVGARSASVPEPDRVVRDLEPRRMPEELPPQRKRSDQQHAEDDYDPETGAVAASEDGDPGDRQEAE